jgi:hypothetical protein
MIVLDLRTVNEPVEDPEDPETDELGQVVEDDGPRVYSVGAGLGGTDCSGGRAATAAPCRGTLRLSASM